MKKVSEIGAIEKRIGEISEVMEGLPVLPGSVLRVHESSLKNWGIKVTPENRKWIYDESRKAYSSEWLDSGAEVNALVGEAAHEAGIGDVNSKLNSIIAIKSANIVGELMQKQERVSIADVGAGAGGTILPVLKSALDSGIRDWNNSILNLIDPSSKRLECAVSAIMGLPIFNLNVRPIQKRDTEALGENIFPESLDLVITNASIHHNSFNFHLDEINNAMKMGAPIISGDWHNSMWESPKRVYWLIALFEKMGDEKGEEEILEFVKKGFFSNDGFKDEVLAKRFRKYFSLAEPSVLTAFGVQKHLRLANAAIMRFWLQVGKKFHGKREKPPIFFLEGHERKSRRIENFVRAGLGTEEEFKYAKFINNRNLGQCAGVMRGHKVKRVERKPMLL